MALATVTPFRWEAWKPEEEVVDYLPIYSAVGFKTDCLALIALGMGTTNAVRYLTKDEDYPRKFYTNASSYISYYKKSVKAVKLSNTAFIKSELAYSKYLEVFEPTSESDNKQEQVIKRVSEMFNRPRNIIEDLRLFNEDAITPKIAKLTETIAKANAEKHDTSNRNNKSETKTIRFDHELVTSIDSIKGDVPFAAWVKRACIEKLEAQKKQGLTKSEREHMIEVIRKAIPTKSDAWLQQSFENAKKILGSAE